MSPPVRRHESLAPLAVWTSPTGRTLLDFGQNLVGRLRVRCTGPAGAEVTLRHAEVLEHGELGTRPLRGARATDTFVLSGAEDVFEPTMTFHGFRYVEVTSWLGELTLEGARAAIEAVVVHSAMERTGWFECSDPDVNRLVENAVWSQRGNFLAVPTDCPQRDERLGWTGDLAVFAPTAAYGFDVADFLHGWLLDLAEETRHQEHGWVPHVVPDVLKHGHFSPEFTAMITQWQGATCIWGDAAVWVPEALWRAYGALDRLGEHYPAMVLHLDGVERALSPTGLWDSGFQFGDWLDPDASPHEPWNAKANAGVVATACLHRSARFAAEAAGLLGLAADAERWTALADRTRAAFRQHYVTGGGARIRSDCATVYALAICFGLLDDDEAARSRAGARLAEVVAAADELPATVGQDDLGVDSFRHQDLDDEPAAVLRAHPPPAALDPPVSRLQGPACPVQPRPGCRRELHRGIPGLGWPDPRDDAVQPVRDRPERVVVEARHVARVDRAVEQHRVPALPDRRRAHRHRVQPRR